MERLVIRLRLKRLTSGLEHIKRKNHLFGQAKHSQPGGVLLKKVQGVCTSTDKSWGSSDVYR